MRVLHTSDWHLGRTIRGVSRADEHRAVLSEMAEIAAGRGVDLTIVAGDVFDTATPGPESEEIAYRGLLALADVAPVVVVAGNHDNPGRWAAIAPLLELGRVVVGSRLAGPDDGGVVVFDDLETRVVMLPWQSQRGIVSAADLMMKDGSHHSADYSARMRRIIEMLCHDLDAATVNIVAGHMTVHGAAPSGSERTVHTVIDYSVPTSAFPGHLNYVALGHFHRPQQVPSAAPVWYSGSPLQLDFGEAGEAKVVKIVDAWPGLPSTVEDVPLASGRPLVRLTGTLDQIEAEVDHIVDGALVRVELDEQPRVGLADTVRRLIPGVVDVVVRSSERRFEKQTTPSRLGRDPGTLFAEYLQHVSVSDERLHVLFRELLEEAHEA